MKQARPVPVFQMKFSLTSDYRVGWIFSDEEDTEGAQSFSYVVPLSAEGSFADAKLTLAGTRHGSFTQFPLEFNGNLFVERELNVRFSLADPLSPQDFRGLPFLRAFPYLGAQENVLKWYGISGLLAFIPLIPLDLIAMDRLYLDEGVAFVGITTQFGPHVSEFEDLASPGELAFPNLQTFNKPKMQKPRLD